MCGVDFFVVYNDLYKMAEVENENEVVTSSEQYFGGSLFICSALHPGNDKTFYSFF